MTGDWTTARLDGIPRLGWSGATSVEPLPGLAARLGAATVRVKRDDVGTGLRGGSKARKLDYLLAAEPYASAPRWHALGGIGSGQLVALCEAARRLGRSLDVHCFWQAPSPAVIENLAFTASGPVTLRYHASRRALALHRPSLLLARRIGGTPVVPPGATSAAAMVGMVRAGIELGDQVRAGITPAPDLVYVALGTGGTVVGLALGLALAGLGAVEIRAVAVVERSLTTGARLRRLDRALRAHLREKGLAPDHPSCRVRIDRSQLGKGYGQPTTASLAACRAAADLGIACEPTYTGKVMAAVLASAGGDAVRGRNLLVWHTAHAPGLPHDAAWRSRLPPALARRLDAARTGRAPSRRRVLVLGAAGATAAIGAWRLLGGYPDLPAWRGRILSRREAAVVGAAAEALLPPAPAGAPVAGVAAAVDRYLAGMRPAALREIHALLALVEHGTTPLGLRLRRLTALDVGDRERFLASLGRRGGLLAQAYRGLRDLCFLGYYRDPATWAALGYDGPRIPLSYSPRGVERVVWPGYDQLLAPPGALPMAWRS